MDDMLSDLEFINRTFEHHFGTGTKSRGGGQAEGTLSCGHVGRVGAPCCKSCAVKLIRQSLSKLLIIYSTLKECGIK